MIKRIVVVMLFCLMGCSPMQSTVVTPLPQMTSVPVVSSAIVPLSADLSYIAPDPDSRWSVVGTDLHAVSHATTMIRTDYTLKPTADTPLAEILSTLTAESFEIQEVDGVVYAEGTSPVSNYILYVDKGDYVLTFMLMDMASDTVDAVYIADWRRIGLEGKLVEMR